MVNLSKIVDKWQDSMKEDKKEKAKENKWQFKKWVEKLTLIHLFFKW